MNGDKGCMCQERTLQVEGDVKVVAKEGVGQIPLRPQAGWESEKK
jgi:hypothetical protein